MSERGAHMCIRALAAGLLEEQRNLYDGYGWHDGACGARTCVLPRARNSVVPFILNTGPWLDVAGTRPISSSLSSGYRRHPGQVAATPRLIRLQGGSRPESAANRPGRPGQSPFYGPRDCLTRGCGIVTKCAPESAAAVVSPPSARISRDFPRLRAPMAEPPESERVRNRQHLPRV